MTLPVSEHDQPHIRSPFATAAPRSRLRRAWAQEDETILESGFSSHAKVRFVYLDPQYADSVNVPCQAAFITAPSMTTPAVTYFHNATSSFRASATMVVFFRRPPLCLTRSSNHRAKADCG